MDGGALSSVGDEVGSPLPRVAGRVVICDIDVLTACQ